MKKIEKNTALLEEVRVVVRGAVQEEIDIHMEDPAVHIQDIGAVKAEVLKADHIAVLSTEAAEVHAAALTEALIQDQEDGITRFK